MDFTDSSYHPDYLKYYHQNLMYAPGVPRTFLSFPLVIFWAAAFEEPMEVETLD